MIGAPLFAAALAALTAMIAARMLVPPRRALAQRLGPYSALARSRLGTGYADMSVVSLAVVDDRSPTGRVLGPILDRFAQSLSRLIDAADAETVSSRLRHAGFGDVEPEQYRMRQLAFTVVGFGFGAFLGGVVFGSVPLTFLLIGVSGSLRRRCNAIVSSVRSAPEQRGCEPSPTPLPSSSLSTFEAATGRSTLSGRCVHSGEVQ